MYTRLFVGAIIKAMPKVYYVVVNIHYKYWNRSVNDSSFVFVYNNV